MRVSAIAGSLLAAFLIIYLPDLGHGFIKDDFVWVSGGRLASASGVIELFERNVGFYRPLVSATFAADYALWHLNAFGYGITNFIIFSVDAFLLFCLARTLTLPREAALLAVAVWAFNFHGVNMALLWISGRTALLLCLFALSAALAVLSGRIVLAGVCSLLAMLCKEEAVFIPVMFTLIDTFDRAPVFSLSAAWNLVRRYWPLWLALAVYLALRAHSGAFGPQDAPSYYRLSFGPLSIVRNVFEYLDRGATFALVIAVAMLMAIGTPRVTFTPAEARTLQRGAAWFVCFYALTVLLPVRSSLYALTPSIGSALAVAAWGSAAQRMSRKRFGICCAVLAALIILLIPIYRQRNERWVLPADLSTTVMTRLQLATAGYAGGEIILVDDPSARFGLDSSFGPLFGDALRVTLGNDWTGEIRLPTSADPMTGTIESTTRVVLALRGGQLTPAADDRRR
jgi:hypothetical protein